MDVRTILFSGFAGITVIMLSGCGDPAPSSEEDVNNITFEGAAVKGIINLGNVVAEELKTDGTVLAQVGNATTGADGSYSLVVNSAYSGGPVRVTVSADMNTQMKCDVPGGCGTRTDGLEDVINPETVDFGEWYKPGELSMMALVAEAVAGETIKVNITPYTDLATNYALAVSIARIANRTQDAGLLTSAGVYNANSEVSNLLGGINILNTQPVDITDRAAVSGGSATEVIYAAVSAAILAETDTTAGGNLDINSALGVLSNSFSEGIFVADDTGTATDDSTISLQEIIVGASGVLNEIGVVDISGILANLLADVGGASGSGGTVDPVPGDTADGTALVKVKAFVGDVRTWGSAIANETGVNGGAFELQTGLISAAADLSTGFLFGPAFFASAEVMEIHFHGRNTSPNLTDYATGLPTDPQFTAGTIAQSGDVITITEGIIDGVTVNMSMKLPIDGEVLATSSNFTIEIVSASFESAATDAYINSGKVVFRLASEYAVDWTAVDLGNAVMPSIFGGRVDLDATMTQKQDEFGTPLETAVTFAGTLSSTFINPAVASGTANDISGIVPGTVEISGNVSDTAGNKFGIRFGFNIANVEILAVTGMLDSAMPRVGLNFTMQLAGLPEVSVNIDGTRTGGDVGIATTTIAYSGRRIEIASDLAASADGIAAVGKAAITNQDGVTMDFDGNLETLEGDVLLNGTSYATISQMGNGAAKITYSDGTFEIL